MKVTSISEMNDPEKEFASAARRELHRIEVALEQVPILNRRRMALQRVLELYGLPTLSAAQVAEQDREESERVASGSPKPETEQKPKPRPLKPEGIPTVFEMVREVLNDGPMTFGEVVAAIKEKWWAEADAASITPDFYRFEQHRRVEFFGAGQGRRIGLTQEGRDFVAGSRPGARKPDPTPEERAPVDPPVASPAPPPQKPKPLPASSAAQMNGVEVREFAHGGKVAQLGVREWRIVTRLQLVMGKGFLPYSNIFVAAYGEDKTPSMDPVVWLSGTVPIINAKLAPLRLRIEEVKKQGYFLKELA